jgi:hypothetical protein
MSEVPAAPEPTRSPRLAYGLLASLLLAAVGWAVFVVLPAAPPPAPASSASSKPSVSAPIEAEPSRPTLAVLGLGSAAELASDAAIVSDALRTLLDDSPGRVHSLPASSLAALRRPEGVALSALEPRSFAQKPGETAEIELVLRGSLVSRAGRLEAQVELVETASGRVRKAVEADAAANTPLALALALAAPLRAELGLVGPGPTEVLSVRPRAYAAFVVARDARLRGDAAEAERSLGAALRDEPSFVLARVEQLGRLYRVGRLDELSMFAEPLLSSTPPPPPRERALVDALLSMGRGLTRDAVKKLEALLDRFGPDVDAESYLVELRLADPMVLDLAEAERGARALLRRAPAHEPTAARLARALALRGRADEAAAALSALGFAERDSASPTDPWAEIWLFRGPAERAIQHYDAVLGASPESAIAANQAIAARILAGRCEEAMGRAEARLARAVAAPGYADLADHADLDRTHALAVQARFCLGDPVGATAAAARWAEARPQGRDAEVALRLRARLLAGEDPGPLAAEAEKALARLVRERGGRALDRTDLLLVLARAGGPAAELRGEARWAEGAAADSTLPRRTQLVHRRLARLLTARALLEEGANDAAIAAYDEGTGTLADVLSEADLPIYVGARLARAEALLRLGREAEAKAAAQELVGLGYARLLATDAWVLAGRLAR